MSHFFSRIARVQVINPPVTCFMYERAALTLWSLSIAARGCHFNFKIMIKGNSTKEDLSKLTKDTDLSWNNNNFGSDLDLDLDRFNKSAVKKLGKKNCYVKDCVIGRKLVDAILKNRVNPKSPILDINAGPGMVSCEFLQQGVCQVVALEKRNIFKPQLLTVQNQFGPERFQHFNWNMLNFFYKFNDQVKDENHTTYRKSERSVFKLLSKSPYSNSDTPYSIFSTGGRQENQNVIFYIMRNLPHEDQILSTGRVEYFLVVHPKFKASVESIIPLDKPSNYTRQFSYFHTFMSLLYDVTFIEEFHVNDFVPPFLKTTMKNDLQTDKRHLMKMQIKENISEILPFEHHHSFSIFLRHIFQRRKARIIPVMEMLVNGCGIRMLAGGFTMMDTVVDLAPERLLQLYKNMVTWPEYSVSHLKNHIHMKTQGGSVEDSRTMDVQSAAVNPSQDVAAKNVGLTNIHLTENTHFVPNNCASLDNISDERQ